MANIEQITETEFRVYCEPREIVTFEMIRFTKKGTKKIKKCKLIEIKGK